MARIYLRMNAMARPNAARAPLLERVLARAAAPVAAPDWREQAFRLIAGESVPLPGFGAAALCGEMGGVDAATVFIAAPVHCEAGMVSVRLPANGLIGLSGAQALELAQDFNRDFSDGAQRLIASPGGRLYCVFRAEVCAVTHDPLDVRGRDIAPYLPAGPHGAHLRGLMSEIEMWLFEHALNRARGASGELPVTGLWLWGGGKAVAQLPQLHGWTAGSDVFFGAWPGAHGFPREARSGVIVLDAEPGGAEWQVAEREWLVPALRWLRGGRDRQIDFGTGAQQLTLGAAGILRFWRRERAWWEYWL